MKRFESSEILKALEYVKAGGQALHVWQPPKDAKGDSCFPEKQAPMCFKQSALWGHLMDMQTFRLQRTARSLGVRLVLIHSRGNERQHVDLCGRPLQAAIRQARRGA